MYKEKRYAEAKQKYSQAQVKDPDNPIISLNLGDAHYRVEELDEAAKAFSLSTAADEKLVASRANYNLGTAMVKAGAPQQNMEMLQQALGAYKNALILNPGNEDAKYNLEITQKLVKEIEEQQQENQDQNDENQDENQDENKDQDSQEQDKKDQREEFSNVQGDIDQEKNEERQEQGEQQQQSQSGEEGQSDEEKEHQNAEDLLNMLKNDEVDRKQVIQYLMQQETDDLSATDKDW
ncbi:tetratricopeptide repeat protein [Candidatus Hydrogenedentota bacterium]